MLQASDDRQEILHFDDFLYHKFSAEGYERKMVGDGRYYKRDEHVRYQKPLEPLDAQTNTDPAVLLAHVNHQNREHQVKAAKLQMISQKLSRCFLYHGATAHEHNCRHLAQEHALLHSELMGFKVKALIKPEVYERSSGVSSENAVADE